MRRKYLFGDDSLVGTNRFGGFLSDLLNERRCMMVNSDIAISQSGYVFNPQTGESFSLNPTAIEVIRMLQDGKRREEIVEEITSRYEVSQSAFLCDLDDFLDMLHQYDMLTNE